MQAAPLLHPFLLKPGFIHLCMHSGGLVVEEVTDSSQTTPHTPNGVSSNPGGKPERVCLVATS